MQGWWWHNKINRNLNQESIKKLFAPRFSRIWESFSPDPLTNVRTRKTYVLYSFFFQKQMFLNFSRSFWQFVYDRWRIELQNYIKTILSLLILRIAALWSVENSDMIFDILSKELLSNFRGKVVFRQNVHLTRILTLNVTGCM